MTLIIVAIIIFCYILIATENMTNINKAASAMFACTLGWVLYICYGTDFVLSQHYEEYSAFLDGGAATSSTVKEFISQNIFIKYVGRASEIVLFLLATMTIVEILNNNGCFDFITHLLKTRYSKKFLWMLAVVTFLISANLDNFTTTVMMLTMMHKLIPNRRQRLIYGSVIVLSANMGGALTVIGDPTGLVLWNRGAVTATNFSMSMLLPCLLAWLIPIWWLGRSLPERVETEWISMPYRGDDTNLNVWQRLLMLFVGIGGLWFIPSFHSITKLSPFVGALCVLSVLWIVNEIFNRKLFNVDAMIQRRVPRMLQYGLLQMMLFVMGIMLAVGVVRETGALSLCSEWIDANIHNVWIIGVMTGVFSTVVDSFATSIGAFSLYKVLDPAVIATNMDNTYLTNFIQNGYYWKIVAFTVAVGGNILSIGSMSGLALIKAERIHFVWYFKNVGWKAMVGGIVGLSTMWFTFYFNS